MKLGRLACLGLFVPVLLATGCAGPRYDYADLPDSPVAIVFRTMAESDQVYDDILAEEKRLVLRRTGRAPQKTRRERNKLDAEILVGLLGIVGDQAERKKARWGRLALVNPRTAELALVDWATRGALPLGFSLDREKLLFMGAGAGAPQIFERNFVTNETRQVTAARRRVLGGAFCGESGIITAAIDSGGLARLFHRQDGGGPPKQVTKGPIAYSPNCSPDGNRVYYETLEATGVAVIEVLDLHNPDAEPRRLTRGSLPVVSPDGSWVIYVVANPRGSKIWRMRPDGTGRHPLGRSGKWERSPSFSPDGQFVVYVATAGASEVRPELWVRPINGDDDRPFRVHGDALFPAW